MGGEIKKKEKERNTTLWLLTALQILTNLTRNKIFDVKMKVKNFLFVYKQVGMDVVFPQSFSNAFLRKAS